MSFLIILALVVILIVQSRSRTESEQAAYRRGYSEGYWRARREADPNATAKITPSTAAAPVGQSSSAATPAHDTTSLDARKQKSKTQTLNVTLYAASLLLVGGVVLFTDAILDHQIGLFIVAWTIVAAYYGVGLLLYESSEQLKSVAVAFIGTALAALPFVGILFTTILDMPGSTAWLITSVVALLAYVYAALRLRSQVLGYALTVVVFSCGLSLVSVLGAGIVWFFVMTLAIAAAIGLVARALPRESSLAYLVRPLTVVGRWLPIATLLASLLIGWQLSAYDQALIWLVAGAYYLLRATDSQSDKIGQNENWIMSRIVLSFATLFLSYALTKDAVVVVMTAAVIGALQAIMSTWLVDRRADLRPQHEVALWFGLGMVLLAPMLLVIGVDDAATARLVTLTTLGLSVVVSLVCAVKLKRVELGYIATAALTMLPGLAVYHFAPNAGASAYAWAYLELALILIGWRIWREDSSRTAERIFTHISLGTVAGISLVAMLASGLGAQVSGLAVVAGLYYVLAWCDKQPWTVFIGNVILVGCLRAVFDWLGLDAMEIVGVLGFAATVLFASAYVWLRSKGDQYQSLQGVFLLSAVISSVMFGVFSLASTGLYANLAMLGMIIGGSLVLASRDRFGFGGSLLLGAGLLTLAMQRMFALVVPDVPLLLYAYWWALVLWLLGYIELKASRKSQALSYAYVGLSIVSLFGLGYALTGDNVGYQLLFIVEHSALLIAGLLLAWRNLAVWGAVGVTLSILWMFRDYTSIFLTLIGLIIILVVVWVVRRESTKSQATVKPDQDNQS